MGAAKSADSARNKIDMAAFAAAVVQDPYGNSVTLGELWQKQTIVFVFLRHFACIACREQAVETWRNRYAYEKSGAKIVFVGNGSRAFMIKFREEFNLGDAPMYTDPTLLSFQAAGFNRGFMVALGPGSIADGVRAFNNGHRMAIPQPQHGDLWQLGGVVVIDPSSRVIFHYISQRMGDYPPENDVKTS